MKHLFTHYLKKYYRGMVLGLSFKFASAMLDLLIPFILAHVIDVIIPARQAVLIYTWGGAMILCSVLSAVLNITANRMAAKVAAESTETIRKDLFTRVMYFSHFRLDYFSKPSVLSRLTTDTYNVQQIIGRMQRLGIRAPVLTVGGIIMTLTLDPVLALVLIGIIPFLALAAYLISRKTTPLFKELQKQMDKLIQIVREDAAGIRVIKALSCTDNEKRRFEQSNQDISSRQKKADILTAGMSPVLNLSMNVGLVGVILLGAYRVNAGVTEVGKILAFMTYFTIILGSAMALSKFFTMVPQSMASADRILQLLETKTELDLAAPKSRPATDAVPKICFEQVSFSYLGVEKNLQQVSFRLQKGQTLGIIGGTGSGKSTLVNLLLGFYQADEGRILLDGTDLRTMPLKELRSRFGVVFQNDILFADSIENNVKLYRDISRRDLEKAVAGAQAKEFVSQKGDDQVLSIKGANLSGGQKQRLFIARALAANPEILILDDASSALDYQTDAALRKAIKQQFPEMTSIVVAQRISSVLHADLILVFDGGRVTGQGTHQELMAGCRMYREIYESQMEGNYGS